MRFRELRKLIQQITPGVSLAQVQAALSSGLLVVPSEPGGAVGSYDWVSNGDENGIFFALGALDGSWSNPAAPGGLIVTDASGILVPWNPPPTPDYLTDRNSAENIFHSAASGSNWVRWDFGTAYAVSLREYTVRNRWDSGVSWPSHWKLQGSEDGVTWVDIDEEAAPGYTAADQWKHFVVDTPDAGPYRYIQLLDTWDTYLVLGEIELYGDLVTV